MKTFICCLFFSFLLQAQEVYQASIQTLTPEVNETGGVATFQVILDKPSSNPVEVNFQTIGHNAEAGIDFVSKIEVLRFAPGEVLKLLEVAVIDDKKDEEAEKLFQGEIASLSPNVVVTQPFAMVTIADDEEVFNVQNIKITESDEDENEASLIIRRDFTSKERVILEAKTEDHTAVSGEDYVPYYDQIIFEPQELKKTITVKIIGDKKPELEEFFSLQIEGISGEILLSNPLPMASILDNDGRYALRFRMSHVARGPITTVQNYDSNIVPLHHYKDEVEEYFASEPVTVDLEYFLIDHGSFEVKPGTFSVAKLSGVRDGQINMEHVSVHYVIGAKKSMCWYSATPMRIQCPIEPIHGVIHRDEHHPEDPNLPGINLVTRGFKEFSDVSDDGAIVVGKKTSSGVFPIPNPRVDGVEETVTIEILKIPDEAN